MADSLQHQDDRLNALHALELLDSAPAEDFDHLCELVASSFDVPTALISLVDRDRQWFKSRVGFDLAQMPLEDAFCAHTIQEADGRMEISDARCDVRFSHNPLVVRPPHIRFYAGSALVTEGGYAIGSLCILDNRPRELNAVERKRLDDFAVQVMRLIALRQHLRRRDPVSGLPNRQQFQADVAQLAELYPGERRLLVLVDPLEANWKEQLILAQGMWPFEAFLRSLALRLCDALGEQAKVYHVDTKRFAFLLPGDCAYSPLLDTLIAQLRVPVQADRVPIDPPVKAGVVPFMLRTDDVRDLLRKGMVAVDQATADGQRWSLHERFQDEAFQRIFQLMRQIPEALERGDFSLAFQPRCALPGRTLLSAEALLRWNHPELGPIAPGDFIPAVEKTALIHTVTRWVIRTAIAQLACWGERYHGRLSLNLSPRDFEEGNLVDLLSSTCQHHAVDPQRLEVEITEGEWLRRNPVAIAQLHALRMLGVEIAIDDFGSGYSNFAYLYELPVTSVKLDRSLIHDLPIDSRKQEVVRALLALVAKLGYRSVAEGIETEEVLAFLQEAGCEEVQGYLLARPMALPAFEAWYDARR
ncbi:diguanylate phosphodiesterase [Pseudomonas oryzihabitans]|nr:diguanylate phosphodiesterase [Pseudomonas psychrotolerans]KTT25027.1 diguanylate phosphodiesterase [Pseudomonas psychrotolerans]KTT57891.1 diguanylate phosphodiesterase [Pseudomonas psychrotolerans]KTT67040.1 diguanylate phosphodiesterase [Pseudomonas psychrotolerans]